MKAQGAFRRGLWIWTILLYGMIIFSLSSVSATLGTYYNFEDGTGNTTANKGTFGTGSYNISLLNVSGRYLFNNSIPKVPLSNSNYSIKFNATGDYGEFTVPAIIGSGSWPDWLYGTGTISLWVYPLAYPLVGGDSAYIMSKENPSIHAYFNLMLNSSGSITLNMIDISTSTAFNLYSNKPIQLNEWSNIIIKWDVSGSRLIVNGKHMDNSSYRGIGGGTSPVYLGRQVTLNTRRYNGFFDELKLYNESNVPFDNPLYLEGPTYNNPIYELSSSSYKFNFTYDYDNYQIVTANMIYNGTTYSSTLTDTLGTVVSDNLINIPFINGNEQNISFYWRISLTNTTGTYNFNTSVYNQTVRATNLGECTGSAITNSLNFSAFDQDTLVPINNWNFKANIDYTTGSNLYKRTALFNNLSVNTKMICINTNTTFYITGLIEYSANGYQPNTYYFVNSSISNKTINSALGLLASGNSTPYIIQLVDQNNLPIQNYYINIKRCYAENGNCTTVQVIKTDANGQGLAFIESYIPFYQFVVYDINGNLAYTSDIRKIAPQTSPYTITLTIGGNLANPISYLQNVSSLTQSLSWDKNTKIVTLTYTDADPTFNLAQLLVTRGNASGMPIIICNYTSLNPSAVILCDLSSNSSGSYSAIFYTYRSNVPVFVENLLFEIETFSQTIGLLGIFGAFIILLICGFLFAYNAVAGIISINIGVIFMNMIGMVNFGIIPITALVAISLIIIIILERD